MEDNRQKEREFVLGLVDDAKSICDNIKMLKNEFDEIIRRCMKHHNDDEDIISQIYEIENDFINSVKKKPLSFIEFKSYIMHLVENRPKDWRKGQAVFNYVEREFEGVARLVQFNDEVDCFYRDDVIEDFLKLSYKRYLKKFE